MQSLLIAIELFVSVALIIVILLQRSEGGALGMGGGGSGLGGLFSPRGATDTLTRTTGILAIAFFLICIVLSKFHEERKGINLNGSAVPTQTAPAPEAPKDQAPAVPVPH
jgi:preprotein translocase subunit SecG